MEYKIKRILHSGSKGIIRGIDRLSTENWKNSRFRIKEYNCRRTIIFEIHKRFRWFRLSWNITYK